MTAEYLFCSWFICLTVVLTLSLSWTSEVILRAFFPQFKGKHGILIDEAKWWRANLIVLLSQSFGRVASD